MEFCENAKAWLDDNPENVVSLHCKAGKGRAGIMAACLMVRMGETADEAVTKYDAVSKKQCRVVLQAGEGGNDERLTIDILSPCTRQISMPRFLS